MSELIGSAAQSDEKAFKNFYKHLSHSEIHSN